jgi:enoyl-CoA hydratase/carnithine racemase
MKDRLEDGVRIITLTRELMNTLDRAPVDTLTAQFSNLALDLPLMIDGAGSVFSSGVDARTFEAYLGPERRALARAVNSLLKCTQSWRSRGMVGSPITRRVTP